MSDWNPLLEAVLPPKKQELQALLLNWISEQPAGWREFDLLQRLEAEAIQLHEQDQGSDPLSVFRSHFILFHLLYDLRDDLRIRAQADLEIHYSSIRLLPAPPTTPMQANDLPEKADGLRAYYLDLSHLTGTDRATVEKMINRFWDGWGRLEGRDEALAELELEDPVDAPSIRRAYKRMAAAHHPDRGGEPERFRRIVAAAELLANPAGSKPRH